MADLHRSIMHHLAACIIMLIAPACAVSDASEAESDAGSLECTFTYVGRNNSADREDMSQYAIKLTAPRDIKGRVCSMTREKGGAWREICRSKNELFFAAYKPHSLAISGTWPNHQYYKLAVEVPDNERHSTCAFYKKNRYFKPMANPKPKQQPEKEKPRGINWTLVAVAVLMLAFFVLLCYCAYSYYPSTRK